MDEKDLISYLIYDEAHCISQWGNGFRPDYVAFVEMGKILVPKAPTILFAATATQDSPYLFFYKEGMLGSKCSA